MSNEYQKLINFLMQERDGYLQILLKYHDHHEKLQKSVEYYEGLWSQARKMCHDNGWKYEPGYSEQAQQQSASSGDGRAVHRVGDERGSSTDDPTLEGRDPQAGTAG